MKVLVFIEADLTVRHFVHSGVFADLAAKHDVTFVFPEPGYKRMGEVDVSRLDLRGAAYAHLTVHQGRQTLWKPLFQIDQLRWRPGEHWRSIRMLYRTNIGPKAAALYTVLSLPGVYPPVRAFLYRKLAERPYHDLQSLLDAYRPDVVIHPCVLEGVYINDLIEALPKRRIPFIAIMNSWDNPSTKRAMMGTPDWLLVWGDQTNKHAIEYAKMPPDRTVNFAAAQFDVFRRQPSISRDAFCRQHDIDPDTRILLYAGSSKDSDEFSHLRVIEEAIDAGRLSNVTVVYRPHPWGGGGKGGERLLDYPWRHVRIENGMRAYLESVAAGSKEKFLSDYRKTHDLLCVIDALVSPLSTIIVEGGDTRAAAEKGESASWITLGATSASRTACALISNRWRRARRKNSCRTTEKHTICFASSTPLCHRFRPSLSRARCTASRWPASCRRRKARRDTFSLPSRWSISRTCTACPSISSPMVARN